MDKNIQQKVDNFFSKFKVLTYKKGENVIRGEDTPRGVCYVKSGYVKMNLIMEDGRELTVNIFKAGSYFPMIWAINNIPNIYFYQAMSEVQLQRAPKEELLIFLKENPDVLFELFSRILTGLNALIINIGHVLSGNAYSRIISVLVILAKRFGEKTGKDGYIIIKLPLTHQDIANIAVITRETVSIIIKQIERKKIIGRQGKFLVIKSLSDLEKESFLQKEEYNLPFTA
ncbi:MAG: Crp/Fnr family transcriptional regulator [Candidatus Levybacteria bacterium]|nr:Crp/Fnr family transcriptional regulator [Candidatus Levybacteria bacterium]